ncbi:hypothetical protein BDN70DRAFT_875628, partial [Pholiota conissans]
MIQCVPDTVGPMWRVPSDVVLDSNLKLHVWSTATNCYPSCGMNLKKRGRLVVPHFCISCPCDHGIMRRSEIRVQTPIHSQFKLRSRFIEDSIFWCGMHV